ncbi:Protein of unknown function [Gryllus bimaculatus]|nr:Protein of unknown function [Gryllus bimaculatus]
MDRITHKSIRDMFKSSKRRELVTLANKSHYLFHRQWAGRCMNSEIDDIHAAKGVPCRGEEDVNDNR